MISVGSEFVVGTDRGEIFSSATVPGSDKERQILKARWLQGIEHFDVHPRQPWIATIASDAQGITIFDIDSLEVRLSKEIQEKSTSTCLTYFRDGSHVRTIVSDR